MDSAIMHTVPSNEDSMVLAVPEPAAAAMTNLKILRAQSAAMAGGLERLDVGQDGRDHVVDLGAGRAARLLHLLLRRCHGLELGRRFIIAHPGHERAPEADPQHARE